MPKNKLFWATPEFDVVGNAFGYATLNKKIRKYSEQYLELTPDSDMALAITSADHFIPVPGKKNVLFTMWEFPELPMSYVKAINRPEVTAIIVPCKFCKDVFSKYTDKPVYVCWLGVEPKDFKFHQRKPPAAGERFRYLWLGAPNPRKGYLSVLEAIKIFSNTPNVELYLKTTVPKTTWKQCVKDTWRHRNDIFHKDDGKWKLGRIWSRIPSPLLHGRVRYMGKHKNIIYDTRTLTFEELTALYNSAHAFMFPTLGEGWGLTLSEAMATGLPCLAPEVTGVADFFNSDVGYPLKYEVKEQELKNYDLITHGFIPDTQDFISKMIEVFINYKEALRRGERASRHILNKFTWEQSGWRLAEIIKEIQRKP